MDDKPAAGGVWGRLEARETESASPASPDVWTMVEERTNPALIRPKRIDEFELAQVGGAAHAQRYTLKNCRTSVYLHLNDADVFLWNLMDGSRSIKALVIELFVERKRYAPDHVTRLVGMLKAEGFLQTRHTGVFDSLAERLLGRRITAKLHSFVGVLTKSRVSLPRADTHFSTVYRWVGRLLFTRFGLLIGLALVVADLALFPYYLCTQASNLLTVHARYEWGVLAVLLIYALSIIIHEYAHALTSKHFGREVNSAGFMLIFGLPAFFVDTTDMFMTRKWPRIAVSAAGPVSNAVCAGAALLLLPLAPAGWPRDVLWTFGTLNTFFFLSNLMPIAESDGDYILMDLLEVPHLRQRAFMFLRRDLWLKWWRRERWSRLDAVLAGYGLLALGGIAYTIGIATQLWLTTGVTFVHAVLANPWLVVQIAVPLVVVAAAVYVAHLGLPRLRHAVTHVRVTENRLGRG